MTAPQENEILEIDLLELLFSLRKRWYQGVLLVLLGALLAFGYTTYVQKPKYKSTSTLLVLSKDSTAITISDLQIGSQLTKDYIKLVTSRPVLEKVIDALNLNEEPEQLRSRVHVANEPDTRIMSIEATDFSAKGSSRLVNTLAEISAEFIGNTMEVTPPKIVETGKVPDAPFSPNTSKNILLGVLLGLVLYVGIVALQMILNDSVKTEEELERIIGVSTLAVIPNRKTIMRTRDRHTRPSAR